MHRQFFTFNLSIVETNMMDILILEINFLKGFVEINFFWNRKHRMHVKTRVCWLLKLHTFLNKTTCIFEDKNDE